MPKLTFLAPFDKYGVSPSINWKGQSKTFSLCGIFATFLILICVVIFAVLFSTDMVHKTNPTQTQSILYGGLNKETRLIENDIFALAFGLMNSDTYTYYQDPTIYSVTANLIVTDPNLGEVSTSIDLESCSNDSEDAMYQGYCFAKTQSQLSRIHLGKNNIARVEISFDRCSATNIGITCATGAEIEDKLFNSIWTTMYSVWSIDPSNYREPVSQDINDEWYDIPDTGKTKKLSVDLMAIEFESDDGWVTKSNKVHKMVTYESSQIDFIDPGYGNTFFFLTLRMSGNKASYSRTYQKIQSVLAQISGTMGLVAIVIGLVAVPYAQSHMYEMLINEAYRIVEKDKVRKSAKRRNKIKQNMIKKVNGDSKRQDDGKTSSLPSGTLGNRDDKQFSNEIINHPKSVESPSKKEDQYYPNSNRKRPQEIELIGICGEALRKLAPNSNVQKFVSPDKNIRDLNSNSSPLMLLNSYSEDTIKRNLEPKPALLGPKAEANDSHICLAHHGDDSSILVTQENPRHEDSFHQKADPELREKVATPGETVTESPVKIELDVKEDFEQGDHEKDLSRKSTMTPLTKSKQEGTTFKEWFVSNFKPSGRSKALTRGKSEVLQHVDVFSIIRRFQEIDNLKACLLNEHQRVLFDNITKPSLVINSHLSTKDPNFITVEGWDESYRGDKNRLCEAYKKVVSQAGRTELDRQVLELFENGLDDDEFEEIESLF